jgi:methanogenesis imperfect marker protein 11
VLWYGATGEPKRRVCMENISEPYVIHYPQIVAVADESAKRVELIEFFDCIGGAMWSKCHYVKSPIVEDVRCVGATMRYSLKIGTVDLALEGSRFPAGISSCTVDDEEIAVTYIGMGGGGVGAAACRSDAAGVLRSRSDPAGGGKVAGATIWLPRMQRVLIGVDDTDTPDEGATWTLVHNIARAVEDRRSVYLSHTIVQLFPVPYRTKNCVALVAEFATNDPEGLVSRFRNLLEKYTLSKKTGMAVYTGFRPSEELFAYGRKVKRGEVEACLPESIRDPELRIVMNGRGIVGAIAAIPFYTRYEVALELCSGKN